MEINQKDLVITLEEALDYIEKTDKNVLLVDVRTEQEYKSGHVKNSVLLPVEEIMVTRGKQLDKNALIFVYCRSGQRTQVAQDILQEEGFRVIDCGGILGFTGELVTK